MSQQKDPHGKATVASSRLSAAHRSSAQQRRRAHPHGPIIPVVSFDESKKYHSATDWSRGFRYIGSGGYADIWVSQKKILGRQATDLRILGSSDCICIAYLSILGRWYAERMVGQACGKRYCYSNFTVGENEHQPCENLACRQSASIGSLAF